VIFGVLECEYYFEYLKIENIFRNFDTNWIYYKNNK